MKVLLDLEGEVDEEVKTVIGDVVKKLNTISKSAPKTSPLGADALELDPRLRGTRQSRDGKKKNAPNWSSAEMTPAEKEEFQKTGRLPIRLGAEDEDDSSEDITKSSKRPKGIEPTGFTHNPGKFKE